MPSRISRAKHRHQRQGIEVARRGGKCEDCGQVTRCLHFHHRDPSTKIFNVAGHPPGDDLLWHAEAAKCDLLCRTCHARRHTLSAVGPFVPKPVKLDSNGDTPRLAMIRRRNLARFHARQKALSMP